MNFQKGLKSAHSGVPPLFFLWLVTFSQLPTARPCRPELKTNTTLWYVLFSVHVCVMPQHQVAANTRREILSVLLFHVNVTNGQRIV